MYGHWVLSNLGYFEQCENICTWRSMGKCVLLCTELPTSSLRLDTQAAAEGAPAGTTSAAHAQRNRGLPAHLESAVGVGVPWRLASSLIYVPQILKETEPVVCGGDRDICCSEDDCSVLADLTPLSVFPAVLPAARTLLCLRLLPSLSSLASLAPSCVHLFLLFTHTLSL